MNKYLIIMLSTVLVVLIGLGLLSHFNSEMLDYMSNSYKYLITFLFFYFIALFWSGFFLVVKWISSNENS